MSVGSYTKLSADGGMITLQPSAVHIQALQDLAKVLPKAAANAQRRAINKTLGWLMTRIARAVGSQEQIAISAVRQRLRSYPVAGGGMRGKLWFGINAIEARRIGPPRKTGQGVSVKGRRYRGAFLGKVYGSKKDIWIRKASKHFSADDYPDSELTSARGPRSGWIAEHSDRHPLAKAKVSLEQARPHFDHWVKQADQQLLVVLRQELNFEMQKYLKGNARV